MAEVRRVQSLTYRASGADCDDRALRVSEKPDRMKECADIRVSGVKPEIVKHKRRLHDARAGR